ncbi:MAG: helix-turn-helix domain-containing protein [Thermogutta sp.]|uniref:helix-turn-helix domain-containing protein n=1 Tax=Thermogutta sp. TaxID=1962930 RepID=UPI0019A7D1AE|nr:helix-turn-helix domain-containing protein [Thermogutta sp.]MBC7351803.1 helix-turn-helix domain-containing protein [Thermogutta sp.]
MPSPQTDASIQEPGSRRGLDEFRKREILAILSVGCSRRTAARYVGCSPSTIRRTAERDPEFAEALRKAETKAQILFMKNIAAAARKEQYWRAAAWALERLNPEDYGPRSPQAVTLEQIRALISEFARIIVEEVPIASHRKRILKRLDRLSAQWRHEGDNHDPGEPSEH